MEYLAGSGPCWLNWGLPQQGRVVNSGPGFYYRPNETSYMAPNMKTHFPWMTLSIGLVLALALMWLSPINPASPVQMPLLMALFAAELGFFATAAGFVASILRIRKFGKQQGAPAMAIGNALLAVNLFYMGYRLWSRSGLGL